MPFSAGFGGSRRMRLALYRPEIPQNAGTLIRTGACLGVPIDIIEPMGFVWNDKYLKRAGMDYIDLANVTRFADWRQYLDRDANQRIISLDTKAPVNFYEFAFASDDILLLGRESDGLPDYILKGLPSVKIPIVDECRSLNVAVAGAMVLTEALRQTTRARTS